MRIVPAHEGVVFALAFSPTGEGMASAGHDGVVCLWEGTEPVLKVDQFKDVSALSYLPSSEDILLGSSAGLLARCRVADGEVTTGNLPSFSNHVTGVACLLDGDLLAIACGDPVREMIAVANVTLWSVPQAGRMKVPYSITGENNGIRSLASLPSQRLLAWVTDKRQAIVWDITRQDPIRFNLKSISRSVAISPDGRTLAVAMDWKITLYDLVTQREKRTLEGHKGVVSSLAFSPDGEQLLTGSWDKTVRFWDLSSGKETKAYQWNIGRIYCVRITADGLLAAAGGNEGKVVIWDI